MDELETLDPAPRTVSAGGETIEVRALTIGQLPAFVRALRPALGLLEGGEVDVVALVAEHGEAVIEAVSVATGRDYAWLAGLAPDAFAVIAGAVLEVNMDFFVRRLAPALNRILETATAGPGAGRISSVTSSPAATATGT
jgi:hypothetical protein